MTIRRRRFRQTTSLSERLRRFADEARGKVQTLPQGHHKDEMMKKVETTELALELEGYLSSHELQPPT